MDQKRLKWLTDNGIQLLQNAREFECLCHKLTPLQINNVLEIGSYSGASIYMFAGHCNSGANIICIDPYPKPKIHNVFNELDKNFNVHLIQERSQEELVPSIVQQITDKVDFLHIDGEHSYEAVKYDFETYSPFVRDGGLIAIHDICGPMGEYKYEVKKYWEELKKEVRSYEEIVFGNRGFGIGIIHA